MHPTPFHAPAEDGSDDEAKLAVLEQIRDLMDKLDAKGLADSIPTLAGDAKDEAGKDGEDESDEEKLKKLAAECSE